VLKDLKQSTRQRFVALEFDYPGADVEAEIVCRATGIDSPARHRARSSSRAPSNSKRSPCTRWTRSLVPAGDAPYRPDAGERDPRDV
jgi:nitric oxide reductase NorQ protein